MGRGRRLTMTEDETFQAWLEKPLSDEVHRLQNELNRLEAIHRADARRLQKAESALIRKGFVGFLGLVALLLWYMNSYLETRSALKEVCAFISCEASAKSKDDAEEMLTGELENVDNVCNEKTGLRD